MGRLTSRSGMQKTIWQLSPIVLLFLMLTGCGGDSAKPPVNPPPNQPGSVAFESFRALDGSNADNPAGNVWLIKTDGSGATPLTRLTAPGSDDVGIAWSPDGKKLAFLSTRALDGSNGADPNFTFNVWVMNADGSGAIPLTKLIVATVNPSDAPVWSPDSRRLTFTSASALDGSDSTNTNGTHNIWVVSADGSGPAVPLTRVTAYTADSFSPNWSPDASKLAYESKRALDGSDAADTTSNLWVVNADGSAAAPLTRFSAPSGAVSPVWSPDGSKLAFESNRALDGSNASVGSLNIWVMNAGGLGATPLTRYTNPVSFSAVVWSPDGKRLAFSSSAALDGSNGANPNSTLNLWLVSTDGSLSTLTKLTYSGVGVFTARWSPDGSSLAFASDRALDGSDAPSLTDNIWLINTNTSGSTALTKLTPVRALNLWPSFKP
jgi:Tol biopolymer transport system component